MSVGVANDVVVKLDRVTRRYGRGEAAVVALREVSFEVARGERVALVGPSGCGKSTTLNLVAGVDRPDEGTVTVCGLDLGSASEAALTRHRRHRVGVVFQAFHLLPHLTAEEQVALPLALAGRCDAARVRWLLETVGLASRRHHFPSELSGGEEQRVAIARALVHRPAVVIADEPTGNLDSHAGAAVLELMDALCREEGAALLLATHDEALAAAADRVLHLRDGVLDG